MQPEFSTDLLRRCRKAGFHTALDTAGSLPPDMSRETIDAADLLLLDLKALDPELCANSPVRTTKTNLPRSNYCERTGKEVWIRHVLLPDITLRMDRLAALAAYLKPFRCVRRVELLPFHKMGEFKWRRTRTRTAVCRSSGSPPPGERAAAEALFADWNGR